MLLKVNVVKAQVMVWMPVLEMMPTPEQVQKPLIVR
jgi:hypothetical protein